MAAHQAPLSLGFSRQEHWSQLPFPSPVHESEVKVKSLNVSDSSWPSWTAAHQVPPSMGFYRQEYWSGMPSPSPSILLASAAAAAKSLQSCPTLQPRRQQPTRLPSPCDSPDKNTGVGCHFLLQCMKVKSESEVAQSCPTLSDPMDSSLLGSSIHGIFQARVLEWGDIAFSISSI